jgi:signal transduction histidine kinase
VNVVTGGGPGAVPLNAWAYLFGALLAVPILFRHRWPLRVLIASAVLMFFYYIFARRNISPAPVFFVPLYDAAVVGYLALAIAIPAVFMIIGLFVVEVSVRQGIAALAAEFLSQTVILALAVLLGEVVRSRRALAAETARRLRLAQEERTAEAGRAVAEERLRIARELHDTVAHAVATIAVRAGSALHVLGADAPAVKPFIRNDPASSSRPPAPDHGLMRTSCAPGTGPLGEPGGRCYRSRAAVSPGLARRRRRHGGRSGKCGRHGPWHVRA